jgi:enoyl-CoA hydratase/carnithine racemase
MSLEGRTEAVAVDIAGDAAVLRFMPAGDGTISNRGAALLGDALARLLDDETIRAVVITGAADGIFIRHANLGQIVRAARALEQGADRNAFLDSPFARLGKMLDASEKPVIAAINGTCMGGGLEIALSCTMRIAQRDVTAIGLPETRLGIPPGAGGPQRLARLIGAHRARLFVLEGRVVDAAEAVDLGIADILADDPVAEALNQASLLNCASAPVVAEVMRQTRSADGEALEANLLGFADCLLLDGVSDAVDQIDQSHRAIEAL